MLETNIKNHLGGSKNALAESARLGNTLNLSELHKNSLEREVIKKVNNCMCEYAIRELARQIWCV